MDEREAITHLSEQWQAGPTLDESVLGYLHDFRDRGLVERRFGDLSESASIIDGGISIQLSACWWFRLTPEGLAFRDKPECNNAA